MNIRRIVPILVLVALVALAVYYLVLPALTGDAGFTVSGTIEATETRLGSIQGGRVEGVAVSEGDQVQEGQIVAEVHPASTTRSSGRELIRSPLNGVVLYRAVEPGEVASPGTPLMTIADLNKLKLTVYVPEDRYGLINLGQVYPVSVDSFPGQTFAGTVSYISDQAEFTPRNVQTTENRKTTVFAIRLDLPPSDGKLKPGMPADVQFQQAR